jgi:hypothetical protein
MSRLTADQLSRGGEGDPCAAEMDSVMWVNLAEGCGAVNAEAHAEAQRAKRRLVSVVCLVCLVELV